MLASIKLHSYIFCCHSLLSLSWIYDSWLNPLGKVFLEQMRFTSMAMIFPTIIGPQDHHRIHKILLCGTESIGALVPTASSFKIHFSSWSLQIMNPKQNIVHSSQFQSAHDKLIKTLMWLYYTMLLTFVLAFLWQLALYFLNSQWYFRNG